MIKVKKLKNNAILPKRATSGSAGADLYACIDKPVSLKPGEHTVIPTGIAVAVEAGFAALIYARSGLAIKHGIGLLNSVGVIDSDYRGEVCVGIINQFSEEYTIEPGERIAQLVVTPVSTDDIVECDNLDDTERGSGGFGSTGKK